MALRLKRMISSISLSWEIISAQLSLTSHETLHFGNVLFRPRRTGRAVTTSPSALGLMISTRWGGDRACGAVMLKCSAIYADAFAGVCAGKLSAGRVSGRTTVAAHASTV